MIGAPAITTEAGRRMAVRVGRNTLTAGDRDHGCRQRDHRGDGDDDGENWGEETGYCCLGGVFGVGERECLMIYKSVERVISFS